ncbi:hypothetical protein K469DRAFT_701610 [Zopfia rhizophila CBS 207.26]|uniref:Uncharacterized protein n=1 Tax=Zopfia rhizophila CBS 207.26 TaxID=1314779 RepID=A0A6A6DBV3_9PEZI|nr:hypothetical protein K469DRAFT_701610 [Zopfia rhizophila CBS 207.26]
MSGAIILFGGLIYLALFIWKHQEKAMKAGDEEEKLPPWELDAKSPGLLWHDTQIKRGGTVVEIEDSKKVYELSA